MKVTLITSCSNRKSIPEKNRVSSAQLSEGSLTNVANSWKILLKDQSPKISASELYKGRGFLEATRAVTKLNADHWVISAGLGLIKTDQKVPGYDLTVSGNGTTSIRKRITSGDFSSQAWWKEINHKGVEKNSLAGLISRSPETLFIFAIPNNYFYMIITDLGALTPKELENVRIIGPTKKAIPDQFKALCLPYDERLDGPKSPIRGTRSDFPQRSVHHFAEYIFPKSKSGSAKKHAGLVSSSMEKMEYPCIPLRDKKTDPEILALIDKNWEKASGYTGRLLRILRDDELVACEQGRFKDLVHKFKAKANRA